MDSSEIWGNLCGKIRKQNRSRYRAVRKSYINNLLASSYLYVVL